MKHRILYAVERQMSRSFTDDTKQRTCTVKHRSLYAVERQMSMSFTDDASKEPVL